MGWYDLDGPHSHSNSNLLLNANIDDILDHDPTEEEIAELKTDRENGVSFKHQMGYLEARLLEEKKAAEIRALRKKYRETKAFFEESFPDLTDAEILKLESFQKV